jgi:hypothetical protein
MRHGMSTDTRRRGDRNAIALLAAAIVWWLPCAAGCKTPVPDQSQFAAIVTTAADGVLVGPPEGDGPVRPIVQLRCAHIPRLKGLAVHTWFVSRKGQRGASAEDRCRPRWERWEVWQEADPSPNGTGYVRHNLHHPVSGVGCGPSWALHEWRGSDAEAIQAVLSRPNVYPWCRRYEYFPGPNSNTYTAWVLRQAGIDYAFPPSAVGSDYAKHSPDMAWERTDEDSP